MSKHKKGLIQTAHDGWMNVLTGLGMKSKSSSVSTGYGDTTVIGRTELEGIYRSGGIGRRIIELLSTEMTREWIEIQGDEDGLVMAYLEEMSLKRKVTDSLRWSKLFGGSIMVFGLNDGGELDDELSENKLKGIEFIHVFDRHECSEVSTYRDPNKENFGEVELYQVSPIGGGDTFTVHESRVIRVDGVPIPRRLKQANNGWGDSVFQSCYEELRNLGSGYAGAAEIITDFVTSTLKIKGLSSMMAAGQENKVVERATIVNLTKSIANSVLLDADGEEMVKTTTSVAGLSDLLNKFAEALSAATGIPVTLLMGTSPGGLNATGDSDVRFFYDSISASQEDELLPILEKILGWVFLSSEGPTKGIEPDTWKIEFIPLWQMSEKERAEVRKIHAETDNLYITNGVLSASEVAISRFGGDRYGTEITIDLDEREEGGEEE